MSRFYLGYLLGKYIVREPLEGDRLMRFSFMTGSIVTVLPLGKLYGKYNAKSLYIISVVGFLASSALCGGAPNMNAMIVGRVFLGMAGNGIYFGILVCVGFRVIRGSDDSTNLSI